MVRSALVAEYAQTQPQRAIAAWSGHPSSELWSGLTQIATAARERQPAPLAALALVRDAAGKAPLAPEPFVVRGVQAQVAGDRGLAIQSFQAALLRDDRSVPARYFLAQQYFQSGDAGSALKEVATLARMVPGGVDNLAPYIAGYAKDPRTRPQMLALFRSDSKIENAALTVLAADPKNSDLIQGLANPSIAFPAWAARLLESLVEAGEYAKARAIWASASHISPSSDLVFDARFSRPNVPAPFNWTLTSSALGLAERQPGGRLHVIYYGQDDGLLAKQLLTLTPGRYRLTMRTSGDLAHAQSLTWTVNCALSGSTLLSLPLGRPILSGVFAVPKNCGGQYIQLDGRAPDLPQQADITISALSLRREPANG